MLKRRMATRPIDTSHPFEKCEEALTSPTFHTAIGGVREDVPPHAFAQVDEILGHKLVKFAGPNYLKGDLIGCNRFCTFDVKRYELLFIKYDGLMRIKHE